MKINIPCEVKKSNEYFIKHLIPGVMFLHQDSLYLTVCIRSHLNNTVVLDAINISKGMGEPTKMQPSYDGIKIVTELTVKC
jgi:hypothetical protein